MSQAGVAETKDEKRRLSSNHGIVSTLTDTSRIDVAVVGFGWYGFYIAWFLSSLGKYNLTLIEKGSHSLSGISGEFGIRLHTGPHYPRSPQTRKNCQTGYERFRNTFPELVVPHAYSIYGLGRLDANNEPPKVDVETFRKVCLEVKGAKEIEPAKWGYENLLTAFNIDEPSIVVGDLLREQLNKYLKDAKVKVVYNFNVRELVRQDNKTLVMGDKTACAGKFDYVVNTTSFQALLPPPQATLPFGIQIRYQACLALVYEDRATRLMSIPPFSFIVMDGWFPCMMPYIGQKEEKADQTDRQYILTHGKFTIMGSFDTVSEAWDCLGKINDQFISTYVQPSCEKEMSRFWPPFGMNIPGTENRRWKFVGWKCRVLGKPVSDVEFRLGFTVQETQTRTIHVFPGKVPDIFHAGDEAQKLIEDDAKQIRQEGHFRFVKGGILDSGISELTAPVRDKAKNTAYLETFKELTEHKSESKQSTATDNIKTLPAEHKARDHAIGENKQASASLMPHDLKDGKVGGKPTSPVRPEPPVCLKGALQWLNKSGTPVTPPEQKSSSGSTAAFSLLPSAARSAATLPKSVSDTHLDKISGACPVRSSIFVVSPS